MVKIYFASSTKTISIYVVTSLVRVINTLKTQNKKVRSPLFNDISGSHYNEKEFFFQRKRKKKKIIFISLTFFRLSFIISFFNLAFLFILFH